MLTSDEQSQMLPHGTNHQFVNSILDERIHNFIVAAMQKGSCSHQGECMDLLLDGDLVSV